ncbi:MAG: PD40 domain-containing protein [Anaerolineae bacterium]|nr:PD40 domain-containing protein [Anaerolineae bacterium]
MSRQFSTFARFLLLVLAVTTVLTLTVHASPTSQDTPRPRFGLEDIPYQAGAENSAPNESALSVTAPNVLLPWSKVAFQSLRNGSWDIFVGNDDGTGQTAVVGSGNAEIQPHLNRGNTKIVYASNSGGDYEIYTANFNGSGQTALTSNTTSDGNPSWSPDGSKIVFEAYRNGEADIYVMNANGTNQVRLTTHSDFDGMPSWSPDGSKIAFVSRRTGGYRIYVMNADGSSQTQLSNQPYSLRPQWSPDGTQIAYDADGDGDGWQDLWRMNADGSSQTLVVNPGGQTDAWTSSWSPDGSRIVYTLISFVYYQGNWYWTTAYPDAWSPNLGTTRLSSNGTDWDATWQTSDSSSPALTLNSIPQYSRNPLTVSWVGTDVGSAGIKSYDVQYRLAGATNWSSLSAGTTATTANFNGSVGQTYQFRVRATDKAFNRSNWQYNFQTTLYSWLISGNITDNRGNPITNATVATTPAAFKTSSSDFHGFFQNFVGGTPNNYSASLFKSGYSALPATAYMSSEDAVVRMVLPPLDNILINWGFEDGPFGPSNWQSLGLLTERITAEKHTGSYSAFMGEATTPQPVNVSTTSGASFSPNITSTEDGKIHIIWLEDDLTGICRVMYRNLDTNGSVSAVVVVSGSGDQCYYNSIIADANGVVHVSWLQLIGGNYHVYYRQRDGIGNWSSIEDVSLVNFGAAQPHLKIRDTGEVYLVWNDKQNNEEMLFFSEREGVSNWSTPLNISPGLSSSKTFDIDIDHLGGIHVLWREFDYLHYYEASILATYRSSDGTWSAPTIVAGPDGHKSVPDFTIDSTGKVHAVWSNIDPASEYQIYYSSRNLDGTWTAPAQLSNDGFGNGMALITVNIDGKLYVLWQGDSGFRYIIRSSTGTWGTIQTIPSINNPPVIFEVDQTGTLHLAWRDQDSNMGNLIYAFQSSDNIWSTPLNISGVDSEVGVTSSFLASDGSISFAWSKSSEELDYIGEIFSVRAKPGTYTLSQTVNIPGTMINPTLSLFAKPAASGSENDPILSVNIDNGTSNQSFLLMNVNDPNWSHYWIDLSPWLGESIQINVSYEVASTAPFEATSSTPLNGFYLDEITLGSSFTDVWIQIDGSNEALRGEEVTYTISYGNRSSIDADDVSITAVLPPQLTFLSASLPPSSQSPGLTWNIGDLPANSGPISFTITARVKNTAQGLSNATSTVNITTSSTELEVFNNVGQSDLLIGTRLYTPLIIKN